MTEDKLPARTLEEGVCKLMQRFTSGDYLPTAPDKRLSDKQRWSNFQTLIQARGQRYAQNTLDNYKIEHEGQSGVLERLRAFGAEMPSRIERGGGLILHGPQGVGKDHLMFSLLRIAILEYGFSVKWVDGVRLFAGLREAIREEREAEKLNQLAEPVILAISDPPPPTGSLTDYQLRVLRDVIDRRYQSLKSTWITTNVQSKEEGEQIFTAPLFARLKEDAHIEWMEWPSYRKPSGEKPNEQAT